MLAQIYARARPGQEDAMPPPASDSRAPRRAALALIGLVTADRLLLSDPACAAVLAETAARHVAPRSG